jgi:glucokinase
MSRPVIGIDLGVTEVGAASVGEGALGDLLVEPTDCRDAGALVDQLASIVERVRTDDLYGVGICVPRIVDFATGRVVVPARRKSPSTNGAFDLPLRDLPLRDVLGDRLGAPVFVDNEASAAALAEAHDEELGLTTRHLVMIKIGAGVGGGLVLDGRIYRGATGGAGELGHTIVGLDLAGAVPAPMRFPQPGSLEFATAGHALDRLATIARNVHPDSALGKLRGRGKPVLGTDMIDAARAGDESAARMVEIWGQRIGIGVANAINTFDPEEVVIAGDPVRAGDALLEAVRRVALQYVGPALGARTRIRLARHGARAGVLGAALLARHELDA